MKKWLFIIILCVANNLLASDELEKTHRKYITIDDYQGEIETRGFLLNAFLLNSTNSVRNLRGNISISIVVSNLLDTPISNVYLKIVRPGALESRIPIARGESDNLISKYNFSISLDDIKDSELVFNLSYPDHFDNSKYYYVVRVSDVAIMRACEDERLQEELISLNLYDGDKNNCKYTYEEAYAKFFELIGQQSGIEKKMN